jgi:NADPH-dependent 2,4-dienoyl-CoA reductase/sulfur reductase-like enzyme
MSLTRRNILQLVPAAAAASVVTPGKAAAPHRVLVIGGGFAGSTLAKYLRLWSLGTIEVTLVESRLQHVSCVMSNLVLNGQLSLGDLSFDHSALASKYGVDVVRDRAMEINAEGMEVLLDSGGWVGYDSLVLAPGVQFDGIDGLDPDKTFHAWIAGPQTRKLRDQIRDMPDDGTFVLTIPKAPYRCPPGPYERACLVADILKRRGGRPKVIVLDANDGIQAERDTFERAFSALYGDIIEYLPRREIVAVDSDGGIVYTRRLVDGFAQEESFLGDVLNVIPRHRAPELLRSSVLVPNGARWAPVEASTYSSSVEGVEGAYVIGDAQGTGQPKSGHMANSQAKVCADAIVRRAMGLPVDSDERLDNITTNSACFSPITADEASWLTAVFRLDRATGQMALVPGSLGEAGRWNSGNYEDMFDWSANLFADTFG